MIQANHTHKKLVVDILSRSFDDNKSVNYVVLQDRKRKQRIRSLMAYAFDICFRYGKVYLSENEDACGLVLLPDKKKTTFSTVLWDVRLVLKSFGVGNIGKVLKRESRIKKAQVASPKFYLWFIGVHREKQGNGMGSRLLEEIIAEARSENRTVCLETSTEQNLSWYEKHGFEIYHTLNFGYPLYFLNLNSE